MLCPQQWVSPHSDAQGALGTGSDPRRKCQKMAFFVKNRKQTTAKKMLPGALGGSALWVRESA